MTRRPTPARRGAPDRARLQGRPGPLRRRRDASATTKAAGARGRGRPRGPADLAPGAAVGRGEAPGPDRPPGDRRRRQGRHDPQGHGRVQPAGLRGHRVQGPDADRARATTTCGGSIRTRPRRARSRSSTGRTTRTSSSSGSTSSSRRRSGGSATTTSTTGSGCSPTRARRSSSSSWSSTATSRSAGSRRAATTRPRRWKFSAGDLAERKLWDDYVEAFEECLERTSTDGRAVVPHPGEPQLVPQPRRVADRGRDPRGAQPGLPAAEPGSQDLVVE